MLVDPDPNPAFCCARARAARRRVDNRDLAPRVLRKGRGARDHEIWTEAVHRDRRGARAACRGGALDERAPADDGEENDGGGAWWRDDDDEPPPPRDEMDDDPADDAAEPRWWRDDGAPLPRAVGRPPPAVEPMLLASDARTQSRCSFAAASRKVRWTVTRSC